ncbi:hypothetical protein Q0F98_35360 [Paenibacillus amylolyticus]|nr:hypothetical protein Q0F98_35360 [Paenibacillus amylolyticus]
MPTIKSMDDEGLVIYVGSFSKILSAGLRVGFVQAPHEVVEKMVVMETGRRRTYGYASTDSGIQVHDRV